MWWLICHKAILSQTPGCFRPTILYQAKVHGVVWNLRDLFCGWPDHIDQVALHKTSNHHPHEDKALLPISVKGKNHRVTEKIRKEFSDKCIQMSIQSAPLIQDHVFENGNVICQNCRNHVTSIHPAVKPQTKAGPNRWTSSSTTLLQTCKEMQRIEVFAVAIVLCTFPEASSQVGTAMPRGRLKSKYQKKALTLPGNIFDRVSGTAEIKSNAALKKDLLWGNFDFLFHVASASDQHGRARQLQRRSPLECRPRARLKMEYGTYRL